MEERIKIATLENVELDFEPAGIGSRFMALLLDTIIMFLAIVIISILFFVLTSSSLTGSVDSLEAWETALYIFLLFLLRWGYFIFFETFLRGQTPGKKLLGIRVVRDNGLPLSLRHALIRNLLRIADMLPPPAYILGGMSAVISKKGQRLGDMAAGTLVVRERFGLAKEKGRVIEYGANWVSKLERGQSKFVLVLPKGKINIRQIALIEEYLRRSSGLKEEQRDKLAWRITQPLLELFGRKADEFENAADRLYACEKLLKEVMILARQASESGAGDYERLDQDTQKKANTWSTFTERIEKLLRTGKRGLKRLSSADMKSLLVDYRRITTDLARAQSMSADQGTLTKLNRMAVGGHNVLYGYMKTGPGFQKRGWFSLFAREVRSSIRAVLLSAFLFFCAAVVSYLAVRWNPELAYELVGPDFYEFEPASEEKMHDIPELVRPVAASSILTNNLQVTILAFALGLTAGLGTVYLLLHNGIHLGSVIGWMSWSGNSRALWGWVMPHGVTEITAIIIAGAAGFLLAGAILAPGRMKRSAALKMMAQKALVLELGCMAMLVVAGLIEGFISPGGIGYELRILILAVSVLLWFFYFYAAGRRKPV